MSVQMQPAGLTQADRDALERSLESWIKYSLDRDHRVLVDELCTEDIRFLAPGAPVVIGRDAVCAWLDNFPVINEMTANFVKMDGRADLAFGEGDIHIKATTPDGVVEMTGKWLTIYLKVGGRWLVQHDCWNLDHAEA